MELLFHYAITQLIHGILLLKVQLLYITLLKIKNHAIGDPSVLLVVVMLNLSSLTLTMLVVISNIILIVHGDVIQVLKFQLMKDAMILTLVLPNLTTKLLLKHAQPLLEILHMFLLPHYIMVLLHHLIHQLIPQPVLLVLATVHLKALVIQPLESVLATLVTMVLIVQI